MESTVRDTERLLRLSGYFGRRNAILVGRDVTGLILLIRELSPEGGRVILPATACMTRLSAVLVAGRKPVVVDIDKSLNMDPAKLEEVAREGDLVIGIHLFGYPFRVDHIAEICNKKGCVLIEDASQGVGGKIDGKPMGSFGRASVLSFSDRKLLPTKGGGAVLTDDSDLYARLMKSAEELPDRAGDYSEKKSAYIKELAPIFRAARLEDKSQAAKWFEIYKKYPDIYLFAMTSEQAESVSDSVAEFDDIIRQRRELIYLLRKNIDDSLVQVVQYPVESSPFRFTFVMPEEMTAEAVENCCNELKEAGMDVTNLYLPLTWLAPDEIESTGCPVAESIARRIVNLRISDTTTRAKINIAGSIIDRHAKVAL